MAGEPARRAGLAFFFRAAARIQLVGLAPARGAGLGAHPLPPQFGQDDDQRCFPAQKKGGCQGGPGGRGRAGRAETGRFCPRRARWRGPRARRRRFWIARPPPSPLPQLPPLPLTLRMRATSSRLMGPYSPSTAGAMGGAAAGAAAASATGGAGSALGTGGGGRPLLHRRQGRLLDGVGRRFGIFRRRRGLHRRFGGGEGLVGREIHAAFLDRALEKKKEDAKKPRVGGQTAIFNLSL